MRINPIASIDSNSVGTTLAVAGSFVAAGVLSPRAMALAGPFTMKQGTYALTVVSDGTLELPITVLANKVPVEEIRKLQAAAGVTGDTAKVEVSPVILKAGAEVALFDTGGQFAPTNGKLMENLKTAGIDPATVTKVIFTHGHGDHLWGVASNGKVNFPNASVHSAAVERDFWNAADLKTKMPSEMHQMVDATLASYAAIKDKLQRFNPGDEVLPGVRAIDTAGHTPGHVSFEVAGGDGLIITGDVASSYISGFQRPDWHFAFDTIPEQAVIARKSVLARSATDKIKLLGYHWSYPGLGVALADGTAFKYEPVV